MIISNHQILTESTLLHADYQNEGLRSSPEWDCGLIGKISSYIKTLFPILNAKSNNLTMRAASNNEIDLRSITKPEDQIRSIDDVPYLSSLINRNLSYNCTRNRGSNSLLNRLGYHGYSLLITKLRSINSASQKQDEVAACLEVGCGEGRTTFHLAKKFKYVDFIASDLYPNKKSLDELIALDVMEKFGGMFRIKKDDFEKAIKEHQSIVTPYRFILANGMSLTTCLAHHMNTEVEQTFDCVFCTDTAPYIPDQVKSIHEIWKCLKIGGIGVFGTALGYFGKIADDLFPEGSDACWSNDHQSIIIRRTTESEEGNLPCLNYRWIPPLEEHLNMTSLAGDERVFLAYSDDATKWHNDHPFPHSLPSTYQLISDLSSTKEYARSFWETEKNNLFHSA